MAISLYELSVPSYLQTLGGVAGVMDKGAEYALETGLDLGELVEHRLHDDMLPFSFQVISVWHHSLGAMRGLQAGLFRPPPDLGPLNYEQLRGLVTEAIDELTALSPDKVNALEGNAMMFRMGKVEIPFTMAGFIQSFSQPNFYFHATTTYAILRQHGVPLGKLDYLGALRVASGEG